MESGFYYDSTRWNGSDNPFWLVGVLPTGEFLVLKNRSDGTNYYEKLPVQEKSVLTKHIVPSSKKEG